MTTMKYWQAVNSALREELARDDEVVLFGEDVGRPGGPFGGTVGLLEEFGTSRVRDTPISEAAIVGAATGAAMTGLRPIVEVMFFDFMTLAMDQLVNQAAKVSYMSGGEFNVPMVVRTLCGAGRGTGPQHSQGLESWIAQVPGLKVVWASNPSDAKGLLKSAVRDDDPVVVIDSLNLWTVRGEVPDGDGHLVPIGEAATPRAGDDLTIVAWGSVVSRALQAADEMAEDGIQAEVLDLRTLSPLDEEAILFSLEKTGRLLIAQDATAPFGVGAEVAALSASRGFGSLRAPIVRVSPPFAPVPFPPQLEAAYFPQADDILASSRSLVGATR